MEKITVLVLSTQRNTFYVNITDQLVDFGQLWLDVSKKRFVKMEGFLNDIEEAQLKEVLSKHQAAKYFASLDSFMKYCK